MYVDEEYEIIYPRDLMHLESEGILISPQNFQYGLIGLKELIGDIYLLRIFMLQRESVRTPFFIKEEVSTLSFEDCESLSAFFHRLPGMTAFDYLLFKQKN